MFGSTILDVAAGIIFGFLAISLFTSASVEAINSALNVRAKNLRTGIMALVNDPNFSGLAKQLYQHALINPLGPGAADPAKNAPSYVDKLQFADAMLDVTGLSAATPAAAAQAPGPEAVAALKAEPGKEIWLCGGAALFRSLLDAGIVDGVDVTVIPILLGSGLSLLPAGSRCPLRLEESKALPDGIVMLKYAVGGKTD